MLVLSRKKNEVIEIDNGRINVMVVEIRGDKVRLGIVAPTEVPVHRGEVAEAIRKDGQRDCPGS
jgi:carbon storage regulator